MGIQKSNLKSTPKNVCLLMNENNSDVFRNLSMKTSIGISMELIAESPHRMLDYSTSQRMCKARVGPSDGRFRLASPRRWILPRSYKVRLLLQRRGYCRRNFVHCKSET